MGYKLNPYQLTGLLDNDPRDSIGYRENPAEIFMIGLLCLRVKEMF
jgi:hypothetical protein